MSKVTVKLLRPLNGGEIGSETQYDKREAERLAGYGAVEIIGDAPVETPDDGEEAAPAPEPKARKRATKGR